MRCGIVLRRIWRLRWKKIISRLSINWAKAHSTVRKLNLPYMTALDRAWQCGTVQLDLTVRLSASREAKTTRA